MFIDGNRIDEFLTSGREADGYADTEEKLKKLKKSFPQTKYLYVYKPIKDSLHKTTAYVAADISMQEILEDDDAFFIKFFSLFFSLSLIIMSIIVELVKSGIVRPINRMQDEIIENFAEMVEARDTSTGNHIKKTAHYVDAIARELQAEGEFKDILTDEYIEKLKRSAPLHDIGKIAVSDLILNKPGKLTDDEFTIMKSHTAEGKNSYPNRISGEDIPLAARIMAVADVFDALVAERIYQKPFTYEKAMEIITEGAGKHFDPVVVKAFCQISKRLYDERTKLDQEGQVL